MTKETLEELFDGGECDEGGVERKAMIELMKRM